MKKLSLVIALTLAFALLALTACSPVDGVKKALEKDGYEVEVLENEKIKEEFGDDTKITDALIASKSIVDIVTVVWFANEDDAKTYESTIKISDKIPGFKVYRDGKMVASGSNDGIELIK